jgi:hypothetical protein
MWTEVRIGEKGVREHVDFVGVVACEVAYTSSIMLETGRVLVLDEYMRARRR